MTDRTVICEIIGENQRFIESISLHERDFQFEETGNYVLVGIRQAGKSYLLYQRAKQFLAAEHSPSEICYINFDDERLLGMTAQELDAILKAYRSVYPHEPILFLDEIQNVVGWEHFARRLANQKYRVFITGSNSKMLSREIATTLGGRYWTQSLFPYSFSEYLSAQGVNLQHNWLYNGQISDVQRQFNDYFSYGGFPATLEYHIASRREWLNELYGKILFSDIIVRNKIKNENALRLATKRLAENVQQPVSCNRLAGIVQSAGIQTNPQSIKDYMRLLSESCLTFSLSNYTAKFGEREGVKKHYFMDNGLLNIFLFRQETALLENICAIHLYRQHGEGLFFYHRNVEVDFLVPEAGLAVQACWSMKNTQTFERETTALKNLSARIPLKQLLVITRDEEATLPLGNGQSIEVVPVWKWLLERT